MRNYYDSIIIYNGLVKSFLQLRLIYDSPFEGRIFWLIELFY